LFRAGHPSILIKSLHPDSDRLRKDVRRKHPPPITSPTAIPLFFALTKQGQDSVRGSRLSKPGELGTNQPEPDVVVPVARRVVVTVRRPAILSVVVPTAATKNPVRTFQDRTPNLCITFRRKPEESAILTNPINGSICPISSVLFHRKQ